MVKKWVNIGYFDIPSGGYNEGEVTFPIGCKTIEKIIPNPVSFFKYYGGSSPGVYDFTFSLIGLNVIVDVMDQIGLYNQKLNISIESMKTYQYVFNAQSIIMGLTPVGNYFYGASVLIGLS